MLGIAINYHSLHISDIFENVLKDLNQHKHEMLAF